VATPGVQRQVSTPGLEMSTADFSALTENSRVAITGRRAVRCEFAVAAEIARGIRIARLSAMHHDLNTSDLLRLIQAEYREIPGLKLTKAQARRLWDIDAHVCDDLFTALLASRFLAETSARTYVLADRH
jgi:hypothetical protein